jgi:hypothetical protein
MVSIRPHRYSFADYLAVEEMGSARSGERAHIDALGCDLLVDELYRDATPVAL